MLIKGYRIQDKDLSKIMAMLDFIRERLISISTHEYHQLLGEEIAFICDSIAMGAMSRDRKTTIYQSAIGNLHFKMENAAKTKAAMKYNFSCVAFIMPYESYTYIRVDCPNPVLQKAFEPYEMLEEYSLGEKENKDLKNAKTITWQTIHKLYEDAEPMVVNLTPRPKADKEKLVFPSKRQRAELHARHSVMNHLLNQISGGQNIAPILLMPYMDLMLELLDNEDNQSLYQQNLTKLSSIFVNLTKEDQFIFSNEEERKDYENV